MDEVGAVQRAPSLNPITNDGSRVYVFQSLSEMANLSIRCKASWLGDESSRKYKYAVYAFPILKFPCVEKSREARQVIVTDASICVKQT